jgi:hypothetical protein
VTKLVGKIQEIKYEGVKTMKAIEKSRSRAEGVLPKAFCEEKTPEEDFGTKNEQLLMELNRESELIESTQETAHQLGHILKFFSMKVAEQEEMSFNILRDAEGSVGYMKVANSHLNSANERSKGMETIWTVYFASLTVILIFYDWWTSRIVYIAD